MSSRACALTSAPGVVCHRSAPTGRERKGAHRALALKVERTPVGRKSARAFPDLREHDGVGLPVPGRGESDGWARSGNGPSEHGQLEPLVAEHGAWSVGVFGLEAVDRHPLLCPAPSLDADVARRDG